jgi:16S rRNA (cytosine967-C5)-methyltransferase
MRNIDNPRLLAFEVLVEVEHNGAYSNLLLPKYLAASKMQSTDKAFAAELVYGSLRLKGRHDLFIKKAIDRHIAKVDPKALIVLRIGVHQLKEMRVPVHAAIYETVELAKRVLGKSTASFINAVLRKIEQTDALEFSGDKISQLAAKYSHPEWIVSAYFDALKDEQSVIALLESNNRAATPTVIAWPGRSSQEELVEQGATPVGTSLVAAQYAGNPGDIPAIRERRAGVQDLGSQLVVELFYQSYQPKFRWLDMCAGPGGKAAYLSSLLAQSSGDFVANELSHQRAKLVQQVVEDGQVINYDARLIPEEIGCFDRILIDAPCTGIGALRRRPEVRWRRSPQDLKELIELQAELLAKAVELLNPGGIIAYVTCSPHQAETTFQIRDFLKKYPNFQIAAIDHPRSNPDGTLQLWTHIDGCDAMFMAVLKKGA